MLLKIRVSQKPHELGGGGGKAHKMSGIEGRGGGGGENWSKLCNWHGEGRFQYWL